MTNQPIRLLHSHGGTSRWLCSIVTACAVLQLAVTSNEVLLTNMIAAGVVVSGGSRRGFSGEDGDLCIGDTCAVGAVVIGRGMGRMEGVGVVVTSTVGLIVAVGATDRQTESENRKSLAHTHKAM